MAEPIKTGRMHDGRFAKGHSGNPKGAPTGSRHKATLAAEKLLDGEAEALTRKAVEMALAGDLQALRLCIERILPPRRERPAAVSLQPVNKASDLVAASNDLIRQVAAGVLTPGEAAAIGQLVASAAKAVEVVDLDTRLAALEAKVEKSKET